MRLQPSLQKVTPPLIGLIDHLFFWRVTDMAGWALHTRPKKHRISKLGDWHPRSSKLLLIIFAAVRFYSAGELHRFLTGICNDPHKVIPLCISPVLQGKSSQLYIHLSHCYGKRKKNRNLSHLSHILPSLN